MSNLVPSADRLDNLKAHMSHHRPRIEAVVPHSADAKRLYMLAISEVYRDPSLLECDPNSFVLSVLQSAKLGLELGPHLGHAYLVPFKRQVQLVPGYQGLIKVMVQSGQVLDVDADVVHEKDRFEIVKGTDRRLIHEPTVTGDPGEAVGAYAVFYLRGLDNPKFCWMRKDEIEKIRQQSASASKPSSPWNKWPEEMWKKCPIRRGSKQVVRDVSSAAVMLLQAGAESGEAKTVEVGRLLGVGEDDAPPTNGANGPTTQVDELAAELTGDGPDVIPGFDEVKAALDATPDLESAAGVWTEHQATIEGFSSEQRAELDAIYKAREGA